MSGLLDFLIESETPYTNIPLIEIVARCGINYSKSDSCTNFLTNSISGKEGNINIAFDSQSKDLISFQLIANQIEGGFHSTSGVKYKLLENVDSLGIKEVIKLNRFSFTLPSVDLNSKDVGLINDFPSLHDQLEKEKDELGKVEKVDPRSYSMAKDSLDMFNAELAKLNLLLRGNLGGHKVISNAWLKLWEMLHCDQLVKPSDNFSSFHNAEFPGSFLFALNHYLKTYHPEMNHKWYASSLVDEKSGALPDTYGLVKLYRSNWLMDEKNNGDVTDVKVLKSMREKIKGGVDLYTSDISIGTEVNQEETEAILNAGQVVAGMMTLKKGGNLVTKQFTFHHRFTISLMGLIAAHFDTVKVVKPLTSRPASSEVYIVALNYHGSEEAKESIDLILESIKKKRIEPLVKSLPSDFLIAIGTANRLLFDRNVQYLKRNARFASFIQSSNKTDQIVALSLVNDVGRMVLDKWLIENPIKYACGTLIGQLHDDDDLDNLIESIAKDDASKTIKSLLSKSDYELIIKSENRLIIDPIKRKKIFPLQFPESTAINEPYYLTSDFISDRVDDLAFSQISEQIKRVAKPNDVMIESHGSIGSLFFSVENPNITIISCNSNSLNYFAIRHAITRSVSYGGKRGISFQNIYPVNDDLMRILPKIQNVDIAYLNPPLTTFHQENVQISLDDIPLLSVVKELKVRGVRTIFVRVPVSYVDLNEFKKRVSLDSETVLCIYE